MSEAARRQNRSDEELAMRALVVPELRKRFPRARIVHELPLRYSSNRIDLAAIDAEGIVSVEIKSSRDVADRLEDQLRGFLPISRRMIVALAPKWNARLEPIATKHGRGTLYEPQYTHCQQAIRRAGGYTVEVWTCDAAAQCIEPTDSGSDLGHPWLAKLIDVLWVAELKTIASAHHVATGNRLTHHDLKAACLDLMTGREIVRAVCAALRARPAFGEGSDPPVRTKPGPAPATDFFERESRPRPDQPCQTEGSTT